MIAFRNCFRNDELDSVFVARLVEILKSSSPSLQGKAASLLECVALIGPTIVSNLSMDIESGLDAVFQQKILRVSGMQYLLGIVTSVVIIWCMSIWVCYIYRYILLFPTLQCILIIIYDQNKCYNRSWSC